MNKHSQAQDRSLFDAAMRSLRLLVLAIVAGALGAYGTGAFRLVFDWVGRILYGHAPETGAGLSAFSDVASWKLVVGLAVGGLLIGLGPMLFRIRRFHGVADVLVANQDFDARIPVREGVGSALFAAFSIGIGMPVGRYGPAVSLGASLGNWCARVFRLTRQGRQTLLGCGVAAAISASFNAPIAGVVFAHEAIIGHNSLRAFAPITIASVTANVLMRIHEFEYIALQITEMDRSLFLLDYPASAVIGLMAAGLSIAFMRLTLDGGKLADRLRLPCWLQPCVAGLVIGIVACILPEVLGLGDRVITAALSQDPGVPAIGIGLMLALLVAKLLLTALCVSWRIPGGVFGPAIFMGAMTGGAFAIATGQPDYQICVLVGMGAFASSVMGAPMATILIVFELTHNYMATTAVMIGVVVANALVTKLFSRSFFHRQVRERGIDLDRGLETRMLEAKPVREIMSRNVITVRPETSREQLRQLLCAERGSDVYVVDDEGRLAGKIEAADLLEDSSSGETAEKFARPARILLESQSVSEALVAVQDFVGNSLPVVKSAEEPVLAGTITEADLVRAYVEAVESAREETQGV